MARPIRNPFVALEGYNCFGCSPGNPIGLKLNFIEDGDELVSKWDPENRFQGYHNVLHGGIQATLMDEIASWTVYVKHGTAGVTSEMKVRFHKAVRVDEGALTLKSKIVSVRRNLVDIEVKLLNHLDILCAESVVTYFTFSEKKSKESLYYPDHSAFYHDEGSNPAL
jgi:uncharacterized protein (TIGR00369 family)